MGLVLNEDQQMIRDAARDFCQSTTPISALRKLRDTRSADGFDRAVWKQMVDLGWPGIIFSEQDGGTGFGYLGLGQILEQTGHSLVASPLFATVVLGVSNRRAYGPAWAALDVIVLHAVPLKYSTFTGPISPATFHVTFIVSPSTRSIAAASGYVSEILPLTVMAADTAL